MRSRDRRSILNELSELATGLDGPVDAQPWILLAEDDDEMRDVIADALRREGYRVREVENGVKMRETTLTFCARGQPPMLIVSDIRMPGLSGLEALLTIRTWGLTLPVIMITAFADEETLSAADHFGATAVLDKPFDVDELLDAVKYLTRFPFCDSGVGAH